MFFRVHIQSEVLMDTDAIRHWNRLLTLLAVAALGIGCQSQGHMLKEPQAGMTTVCKVCYDEAVNVHAPYGPRWGAYTDDLAVKRHRCRDCGTDMVIYVEDGRPMIKCARCAPEGVACDECLPPTDS